MSYYEGGEAILVHHECVKCGSSDAAVTYKHKTQGYEYVKCYSCGSSYAMNSMNSVSSRNQGNTMSSVGELKQGSVPEILRGLTKHTLETYGIEVTEHDTVIFPYYDLQGNLKAQKLRENQHSKKMQWRFTPGFNVSDVTFFGLGPKTPKKGKYITITEGEFDAPSVYQMLGSKWPCISIKNGAQDTKITKEELEFLNRYENIILCFDNDDQGSKAVEKFSEHFEPGKVKIVKKTLKDANEYLESGKGSEYTDLWFRAVPFSPAKIVYGKETLELFEQDVPRPIATWPWDGMNKRLIGIRDSETIVIVSGSGVGKTACVRSIAKHLFDTTDYKIGIMFLEEPLRLTLHGMVSLDLKKNLRIPNILDTVSTQEKKNAWIKLFNNDRWIFWDHFGDSMIDNVIKNIRFMVSSFGAKFVFVDNLTIITGSHVEDERKALDEVSARLAQIATRLNCTIFAVCHLKRPDGTPHEEGGKVSLSQLRGSGGIGNFAFLVLGLERDTQHDDEYMRSITRVRCLKDRWLGETGLITMLHWDTETSQLTEVSEDDILFHKEQKKQHVKSIRDEVKELANKHDESVDS